MTKRFTYFTFSGKFYITFCCIFFTIYSFSQTEYEAPKLTCIRNVASDIELNWQLPLTVNPCFSGYEIYSSIGNKNGPYTLHSTIANPLQTTTLVTIVSSGQPVYFYMINRGSCNNPFPPLSKTSDTLDNIKPQPYTAIEYVTVINGQVHVSWYPAVSAEVSAYLVYNDRDGFTKPDTVIGRLNTTFIDTKNNPDAFAIRYKIRALEYCEDPAGLQGAITPDTSDHKTILMQIAPPDQCTQTATISWQAYKIGSASVVNYEVQKSINNSAFVTEATISATTTNYLLTNIPFKDSVCIRIKANLPNGTLSLSNVRCFSANVIQKPVNDYIRNITVENGNILIEYRKDTAAAPAKTIILQRSNDGIVFTPVINTPTTPDIYTLLFTEEGLKVNDQVYTYKVNLLDSCFNTHSSDTATTIRTGIKVKSNNKADIVWSGFAIENSVFDRFRLEKIIGNDTIDIGSFNRNQTTYLENNLFDYTLDSLSEVCYRVTAFFVNNNDNPPRATLASHSNIVCVQPEPKAFIPQAFAPEGYNKTIKPFLLYAKPEGYDFKIYDRWYQLLFTTNDINASWNGTTPKGNNAPLDGYIYVLKFVGKNEIEYTQTGTIMLLR